ncbi:cytoskeletal protein binding protein [Microbotryomycetes sp. JL221]|nr:cytoskeletal protein binding protein [Microbotryomycetes sp. JL221]
MWQSVLESPAEKQAFLSLLDEYFQSRATNSNDSTAPLASPSLAASTRPPAVVNRTRPAGLTTVEPTRTSGLTSSSASTQASPASVSLTNAALKQPAMTSAALRQAGMSPAAAGMAARFGAQHSEKLAPHVAAGIQAQMSNQSTSVPPKGPRAPSGLQSSAAKSFGKALLTAKAPMSKEEAAKKGNFNESLAVKSSVLASSSSSNRISTPPPPLRGAQVRAQNGLGRAKAMYDFEGTETSDLPVVEGEVVTVVEHVSEDWWKCRNDAGAEGLIPRNYLGAQ